MSNKAQAAFEAYKKRKNESTTLPHGDTSNKAKKAFEAYQSRKSSPVVVDGDYINSFINDSRNFFSSSDPELGSIGWGNAADIYNSKKTSYDDLTKKATHIRIFLDNNKSRLDSETYQSLSSVIDAFDKDASGALSAFKSKSELFSQFTSEDEYNTWYADWKKKEDEKQAVLGAEDFEQYYNAGVGVSNPTWDNAKHHTDFLWFDIESIGGEEIGNMVTFAEANKLKASTESGQAVRGGGSSTGTNQLINLINEYMKEDEKKIYNYYIGKGETEKAEQYLNSLKDTFVQRQGGRIAENVKGDRLGEVFFAAAAGLDQFASGIGNIDNLITGAEADPLSAIQYANPLVREDMNGGWGVAYDLMSTTANVLPSILVGSVTGGTGTWLTLGASAAGNGYAEMRRLGYDEGQSRGYGVLVGASEAVLSKFLGGIGKRVGGGDGIFQAIAGKIVPKLDKAIARVAIQLGANMADEGLEEMIQEVLDPIFKMAMTGEDFEGIDIENVLYSGLLGALSAGMLEGVPSIAGTAIQSHNASKVYGADANALVTESLEIDPNNAHAQRMKARIDNGKGVSGYQLNRLAKTNESTMHEQDRSAIQNATAKRLEALGETENVEALSKALAKYSESKYDKNVKLSRAEKNLINNSKYGRRVANELNPESIEALNYKAEWVENIGTNRISAEAYNKTAQVPVTEATKATVDTNGIPITKISKENAVQSEFEASKDITHTIERDGKEVKAKVAKIASIENGKMSVELDDGSIVDAGEINYSAGMGLLYQAATDMASRVGGFGVDAANVFVNGYNAKGDLTVGEYVHGFSDAYRFGTLGYPVSELERGINTSKLTDVQRTMAYNFGKAFGNEKVAKKQENIASTVATSADKNAQKVSESKKGKVHFDGLKYGKSLNERQKTSIKSLEVVAEALGIDIYLFESEVDENGKRIGENGSYDPETNSIRIDLYAGRDGNSLMLFTAAHELTHHIREVSPAKFKVFADFLLAEYGKRGVSVEQLIKDKMDALRKSGRLEGKTEAEAYDLAYEEVIADSCEAMLVDSNAIEKLAELKAKDKGLWQTIKDFIAKLVARITNAYEGLNPDSAEGKYVREMLGAAEQLQKLWVDALLDASEQFSTDSIRGNADGAVAQNEVTKAVADIASNETLLSIRTEYEAMPKQVMNLTNGAGTLLHSIEGLTPTKVPGLTTKGINGFTGRDVRAYAMGVSGFTSAQIKRVNTFMDAMADLMKQAGVTYKFIGLQDVENAKLHYSYNPDGSIKSIVLSAMVKNGDYPVNFDLSSICKKRVAMSALIDKLAKRGSLDNGTVKLTPANIFRINTALKDAGYETACLGCFVESKRYNSLEWATTFCNKWNAAVKKVNPNATYFGYGDASFNEDAFTLEQAIKIEDAANKYVKSTKVERMANALEKYRVKERAGQPLVDGKIMKVDGVELNTFSKAARDRLMKSDTISEELKTKYLTCDVSTLTIDDVEFLLENGVLPGAALSNKQAVTEMVKSGEAYQHLLRPSDLLTDRGISKLEALPNFHGVLYGHYGSGTPKLMQSYTPYNSEIALLPANKSDQSLAEYLYTIAGVRMQSFSDFQIQNIYDYLQMVADLAARKLPAHAYTKEISFAKLLGMTGIKVNLSVMFDIDPLVDKDHAGLTKLNKLIHRGEYAKVVLEDAQGQWVYNIGDYQTQRMFAEAYPDEAKRFLQSIGFADAVKLQSSQGYSANCGIIGVGYSDLGIFAMLDDNRIRYIIPYHASSLPSEIKVATHIDRGTDYTPYQNNMKIVGIVDRNGNAVNWTIKEAYKRLGSGQAVINELNDKVRNEGWVVTTKKAQTGHGTYGLYEDLQQTNDPRQTAGNFMDWCIKNSTLPLFYQFASHNNYYKLLYDFNVYDCVTEEYAPQQAVTNTYPTMVDGQVQAGNVTDGKFDTEYLQGTIDKQMAFMDEYGRNLDEDLDRLSENMEEGNYSLNKKGLVNGKLLLSDRDSNAANDASDLVSHIRNIISQTKGWRIDNVFDYVAQNPGIDFVERIFSKDKAVKSDLESFLSEINDAKLIHDFSWFIGEAYIRKDLRYGESGRLSSPYQGAVRTFRNATKKRINEIAAAKVGGTNLGVKNGEISLDDAKKLFDKLNSNDDIGALAEKVFATARKLGVNIRFANQVFSNKKVGGNALGDMIELKTSYFNDAAYTDQKKAQTLLHELIHTCTVYVMTENPYMGDVGFSGLKSDNYTKIANAATRLNRIYYEIKDDPAFSGTYGIKNAVEMVAELSNPDFVDRLKKKTLWQEVLDWICELFGFSRGDSAYDNAAMCLDYILDNPEVSEYKKYASEQRTAARRNGYDVFGKTVIADGLVKYSDRDSYAPTFYSHMGKVIDGIRLEKMGAGGVVPYLKGKGVKNEEIKWSGIEAFLEGKKSVTKAELQEFVAGSQLQVVEQMSGSTKLVLKDGTTYDSVDSFKEAAYSIADEQEIEHSKIEFENFDDEAYVAFVDGNIDSPLLEAEINDGGSRWSQYKLDGGTNYREIVFQLPDSSYSNRAMRAHWGQDAEGVLAHARIQDFTTDYGKKMLFIEELQSDWHNEGLQKGYSTKEYEDAKAVYDKLAEDYANKRRAFNKYVRSSEFRSDPDDVSKKKFDWLRSKMETAEKRMQDAERDLEALNQKGMGDVPDAPFRSTYHEYVLKRLLRMAAEEGYDSIGWTTAETQSNRWSNEYAEAYRIEYDQEMPKFLRKYGKKWGVEVDYENLNGEVVWSMPIPSSMKDSVLHEGQVLYSDRYQSADTNSEILSLIEKVGNGDFRANEKVELGTVSDSTATEIQSITGVNVKGFKVAIEARQIEHILKDHGKNGTTDRSMANPSDIAKIEFALKDYDDISPAGRTQAYSHMVNGRNRTADTVLYEKEIGEKSYYVVQAVPDTKAKTLYIVTAFIGKKGYKKEASQLINAKSPDVTAKTGSADTSDRIISQSDDFVKGSDEKFSERDPDSFSNRSLLAGALETVAQNDIERDKLKQYKQKIDLINAEEQKLRTLREKIKELYRQTGPRGSEEIRNLQFEANQAANRINTYDRQLLTLESTKALKGVLEREKEMVRKRVEKEAAQRRKDDLAKAKERAARTERELMNRYQESRKKATESRHKTEMRNKIKDVVNELNQYLLKGTKDKHVPIELQKAVAEALDAVNMDTVGAEERLAEIHNKLQKENDPFKIEQLLESYRRISEMGERMDGKLQRLKAAYDDIVNSNDPLIANSHDEVISNSIANVISEVGSTPLRDMTLSQLESVYDMYKMVLTTIRNTNKAFKAAKSEEISVIANRVMQEVDNLGEKKLYNTKAGQTMSDFSWNNLKPVYAFERIGSATFTEVFNNVRAGEDTWAKDMTEAQAFREDQFKKYKHDAWDFKKRYSFTSTSGKQFELSLEQIMSLYAYSKREQAKEHLKKGGIVIDETTEVTVKTKLGIPVKFNPTQATAYNLSDETLSDIISKLTTEQKEFVDAMQDYLSATMGEKGNEVSLELYGVKLFKEKHYFPLKSASQFMAKVKEQQQGETKVKNKGFSKETVKNASNPIVLTPFMDVWAGHVNEMSMYHAFVLPLEDFYRVYNYKTPTSDTMATESVEMYLQNAHGKSATKYIDQLLKDLNGGARSDPRETLGKTMMSNFKKASVMASLSVVIQQPSAIVRATALVDAKHFVGKKPSKGNHKAVWEEVKKYAPIAVIKEMGYFDTGMGKSSVEWLKGEKTFMDKVDDFTSKAPAYADEMAWIAIWNAVKRETLRNNKNLKANSEEFFKVVGERFTEVIVKTQVYDSTLARSANMRSKSALMSMWTAFMAEPTTSINMLQNALTQRKRGNKKALGKAIKAVYGSVLLNSALVSLVYAMRDDDEDETFLEKYLSRLTTEVIDGINPITYIPFFKDIWSLAQGFDVERADMSLINDVLDSFQQMVKLVGKDTSDMDEDERSEHKKAIASAILGVTDSLSSLFGVPVKNVRRDLNGIINAFNTAKTDLTERDTSLGSLADNVIEDVKNSVPVWGWLPDEQKSSKLYDAIINGDKEYLDRLKGSYKSDTAYQSAIRKALRDNDPRIKEAAEARFNGNTSEYMRIAKKIIAEGNFSQDDIVAAINSEVNALAKDEVGIDTSTEGDKVESIFEASDFFSAIQKGDIVTAYTVKEDIINAYTENGKDRDEAEAEFNSDFASHIKKQYEEGGLTASKAKNMLVEYGGKTTEEANSKVQYWEFKKKYPEYDFSESAVTKFYEEIEPAGISISVYADYVKKAAKCEGTDKNGDGKTDSGSKKAEVLKVINSLPISSKQKDALYFAEGWAASTLYEAPWH